jgi:hypothetical protein
MIGLCMKLSRRENELETSVWSDRQGGAGHVKVAILKLEGKQVRGVRAAHVRHFTHHNTITCTTSTIIATGAEVALRVCLAFCAVPLEWEPGERRKRSESTCNGEESNMNSKRRRMSDYAWILVLVGWFVLMKFVLPRFGVST